MTREQQGAAWRSLPDGFKKEVSRHYKSWHDILTFEGECAILDYLFGKHNLTASEDNKPKMMSKEKLRLKFELADYSAKNHKKLEAQEVKLGDVVMVLVGKFAGEKGVVKGIMIPDNDFNAPYYEVDMECEVPDKYKCRKALISPNNVIGGLTKSDFEVIGNRAPSEEKPKTMHIRTKHGTVAVPTKIEYGDSFWLAYRMELAKEVVNGLLFTDKSPETIADETTTIVNGIVERLKGEDK